jgi:di/tricarboxylate transporter
MAQLAQDLLHGGDHAGYSDHGPNWLYRDLGFDPDSPTGIAYAISEWIINFVGPVFWISLIYLFLLVELGNLLAR